MLEIIAEKLTEIETNESVRILHAVESGSRAWGFASPDSDYDVRFIYVRKPDFYWRLGKTRDVIEWQLDEVLDINGWDLDKTLRLMRGSNPTLFEWMNSPVIYRTTTEWEWVREVSALYFQAKSALHHYFSMAAGNYREHLRGDTVTLKKYLYVLRPILACQWILDRKTPPPVLFADLVSAQADANLTANTEALLEAKVNTPEKKKVPRIEALNQHIETTLPILDSRIAALPGEPNPGWEELDSLFTRIVLSS
ncbi:MAG: nucleotidyltransferase domain-containing protein [Propionibacteriaceae bacterium]|jgi:predicted nucleotidyltransferase|nr:nucleotidyltransferase domain-containing protein [Propionibacteriaceae bacterium]